MAPTETALLLTTGALWSYIQVNCVLDTPAFVGSDKGGRFAALATASPDGLCNELARREVL